MTHLMLNRIPPQAIELEQCLLSACLIDQERSVEACADTLYPDDFYPTKHRLIFEAILRLRERRKPTSLPSVAEELRTMGKLEAAGGASYLVKLVDEIPMATHVLHYAEIVKTKSTLRELIRRCQITIKDALEPSATADILDQANQAFLAIGDPINVKVCTADELMSETVDNMELLSAGKGPAAMPTGLINLDNSLGGGFQGAKFVLLVGRPGEGKTAAAGTIADKIAVFFLKRGLSEKVGILELEMERRELGNRVIAARSGINTTFLFSGREKTADGWHPLSAETWQTVNDAAATISRLPILIDDTPALALQEVVRRVRMMHRQGCKIVFIDQLSKIRGPGKTEYEQKTAVVNRLAELKKELRIPIVLLAQINRGGGLKSTGALEEDADIIIRLKQTDEVLGGTDQMPVFKAFLCLDKNRGGATGSIPVQWVPHLTTFRNIANTIYD